MKPDAVYEQWARWLVLDTGAPWNWRPDTPPPKKVLEKMPVNMYAQDNVTASGEVIHEDVTVEDYRLILLRAWDCDA